MERNTRQREAVLDAIGKAGCALTPAEILALAQPAVASLNLSTIYRHIHALQNEARVVKVLLPGLPPRFEAACAAGAPGRAHHHHHFHCERCDRVYALHGCPGSMQEIAPPGFEVVAHEITLRGICATCREGGSGMNSPGGPKGSASPGVTRSATNRGMHS